MFSACFRPPFRVAYIEIAAHHIFSTPYFYSAIDINLTIFGFSFETVGMCDVNLVTMETSLGASENMEQTKSTQGLWLFGLFVESKSI